MKFKELKDMSKEDLETKKNELLLELMKENAQVASGTIPKNPGILKKHKKTIARIHTAMRQRRESQ